MVSSDQFPCSISLQIPLSTARLATIALQALQVDPELSPLVQRKFSTGPEANDGDEGGSGASVLTVHYQATTNRMLRVAVNSFMDSLKLVLEVMEQLDGDVLEKNGDVRGVS
ncbi:hypothetical protein E4U35_004867 [Claviceps purpurea]|nr:hypothetical protein E4U12_000385 [Claviceps purpurea]KAG6164581.1 hypothetical protein E4U11_001070 [Claviceps purpurea]KAG6212559.1 hypothetical protein E4U35_004867 [Claviceps purpurea]KAG6220209.1 hypothetical protein E4U34_003048 [Claviceps purpurea]KAG6220987.1 hypothetical protein E4U26_006243 [Claviceps purpurea]